MVKKTVQVRIPVALANDVALIAAALGKSVPEWVEEVVAAARDRDMHKAAKIAQEKANKKKPPPPAPTEPR